MNEEKIYKIKRANSFRDDGYDKQYRNALNDSRFRELLKTNSLDCEFFTGDSRSILHVSPVRYITIDPTNVCATIVKLYDDYIEIKLKGPNSLLLQEALKNDSDLKAYCRVLIDGNIRKEKIKIITFDIICRRKYTFITKENNDE